LCEQHDEAAAGSDNRRKGASVAVCTRATMSADGCSVVIIQAAPMDWITAPKLKKKADIHSVLNKGVSKGASVSARQFLMAAAILFAWSRKLTVDSIPRSG
jgi:hypothetical protein